MLRLDYDLLDFWFKKTNYVVTKWHRPIHEALLRVSRTSDGKPQPNLVVLAGGEQSGKSYSTAYYLLGIHWSIKLAWLVGDRYQDCRFEFQYLTDKAIELGILDPAEVSFPQEGPCKATFRTGCIVRTLSSADVTTLASEAPDFIAMVEAGRQSFQAFRTLWARAHHNTATILAAGTFESTRGRWFPDLWKNCQGENEYNGISLSLPSYANPEKYPEGENDPKIQAARKTLSEEEFAERFLGTPRPSIGVVFPEFRRSVHVRLFSEYDPAYSVRLWVDPGYYPSSYAILFVQIVGDQVRIFDEIYTQHLTNEDVIDLVKNHRNFSKIEKVVIDVAAQTHAGMQEPGISTWRKGLSGRGILVTARYVKIEHGLQRTHDKLRVNPLTGSPYMIFHPRCENTIFEFEEGYKYHVRNDMSMRSGTPIDKNNHSAKAIAYGLVDQFGYSEGPSFSIPKAKRQSFAYDRVR